MRTTYNINLISLKSFSLFIVIFQALLLFVACSPDPIYVSIDNRIGALPETVIDPADNPRTPEKVALGRMLFWDPVLSGNNDVACVTCHHPNNDYAERLDLSIGVGGHGLSFNRSGDILVKRNAPTILNTAFNGIDEGYLYDPANTVMFWDNRSKSLEEQSLEPIKSMEEMRGNVYTADVAIAVVSSRLNAIPEYVTMFNNVFGEGTVIDGDKIGKAIAAFERTLIANNSRFDQYVEGDETALNAQELRGMNAFVSANCVACHNGPMFSDYELHDLGVPNNSKLEQIDEGVNGKFRTASLRNLPKTGPYMHNGVFKTLTDVVNFYDNFERNDADAQQIDFDNNPDTVAAIVAFLKALSDSEFDKTIPESVPSGLPVGGNIE
ncbi:cytochrome c peroxidase [uncultured Kordia sp.]|uniref:cytochrome-c peroxidase n=1 Tax=uncultured Kordia sp. TaxID=507699 RepID=UPI00262F9A44|nr:cytochrome c peroxidase [uncultured Kordia sp.]